VLYAIVLVATVVLCGPAHSAARFGTYCQSEFQNGWRETLPYAWERCGWFNDELDDTDTKVFYWNLHGARGAFSSCDSCGNGVDDVHLFYVNTHGGAINSGDARLTMWDQNTRAFSITDAWRYGDENSGVAFFAQYACETLTNGDGNIWGRWRMAFSGGLIMSLGSHDKLWDSSTTNETGEDFADGLQKRKTVKWAWFDGNGDWDDDQDVAVMATGSVLTGAGNAIADCDFRRDRVTWQNFGGFARWRDGQIGRWCMSWIDDN
jgi:hypothetical protein